MEANDKPGDIVVVMLGCLTASLTRELCSLLEILSKKSLTKKYYNNMWSLRNLKVCVKLILS